MRTLSGMNWAAGTSVLLFMAVFASSLFASSVRAASPSFVGAERCRSCHEEAFAIWKRGPHARAHKNLNSAQRTDPKCKSCHTMLPSAVTDGDDRFVGVQCESCHGPGRYYVPEYVMKDAELSRAVGLSIPTAEMCQRCHTAGSPSVGPFSFDQMWSRIKHGRVAGATTESR